MTLSDSLIRVFTIFGVVMDAGMSAVIFIYGGLAYVAAGWTIPIASRARANIEMIKIR